MEFRIKADVARVVPMDGHVLVIVETTDDEMESAVKDRPSLMDRCKRLAEMVRETQTPEPVANLLTEEDRQVLEPGCNKAEQEAAIRYGSDWREKYIAAVIAKNAQKTAEPPQSGPEPVYNPIQRRLDDGWPAGVSQKARKMFGGAK